MQGVHFTILPATSCAAEFYEVWHTRSTRRHNHVCQIFSQSVWGLWSSATPKIFPIDLLRRPYNSVRTAVQHCDSGVKLVCRPSGCCVYVPSTTWWRTELYCRRHYHCSRPLRFWLVAWTAARSDWSVSIQLCCSKRTGICEQWSLCFISRSACVHVLLL